MIKFDVEFCMLHIYLPMVFIIQRKQTLLNNKFSLKIFSNEIYINTNFITIKKRLYFNVYTLNIQIKECNYYTS